MRQELRENDDGTVSLIYGGRELTRAMPPRGGTGVDGLRELYDLRPEHVVRVLRSLGPYIMRTTWLDTYEVEEGKRGFVVLRATWPGGAFEKAYSLRDMPRLCRMRRTILADVLSAKIGD